MAQLNKIRYGDGRVVRPGEWTAGPLYSSVDIGTGPQQEVAAFSFGIGGDVPGSFGPRQSTLLDTNMEGQGSILAENEHLLIFGLNIELYQRFTNIPNFFDPGTQEIFAAEPPDLTLTNVLRVQADTLIELRIANTKQYLKTPLGFLPSSRGVHRTLGATRTQGTGYTEVSLVGQNGGVSENDHRTLATPQEVAPGENFLVQFDFPEGQVTGLNFGLDTNARITAVVSTRGVRRRPVA